jgi:hypothetical protein
MAKPLLQFPHNYNYPSRAVMYEWMNEHLRLGLKDAIVEEDFRPLSVAEMSVWDAQHPKPAGGEDYERSLLRWITEDSQRQLTALIPKDEATLAAYRRVVGGAVDVLIGRGLPDASDVEAVARGTSDHEKWTLAKCLVRYKPGSEELPVIRLQPKTWGRRAAVWVDKQGKQSLFTADGSPRPEVRKLLAAGVAVVGVDLLGQGEFTADGKPLERARLNGEPNSYAAYTYGYNHPLFSQRVHDILTVIAWLGNGPEKAEKIDLVGLGGAGHWVAAARAQAGAAIERAAADTAGFRFATLKHIDDPDFLPGGAKYLDLPGMLALSAPLPLWLAGEGEGPPPVLAAAYKAAGGSGQVTTCASEEQGTKEKAAVQWLLQ